VFVYIISVAFDIYLYSHANETTNADAAVILGASVWNNMPSPVFRERINHGIWLYKNGYIKYLIFTGGAGKNSNRLESSVARDYALSNTIPGENIFVENISRTTLENIIYAKKIIETHSLDKIIIVSDPLHMRRAMTMAKDNGLNVFSSPTPTTRYISMKTKTEFLLYETLFYAAYEIRKFSSAFILYSILFLFLFSIYYFNNFRQNIT
jgi:uncharacterized SAM-binding protein YcdF (DUF218 family)